MELHFKIETHPDDGKIEVFTHDGEFTTWELMGSYPDIEMACREAGDELLYQFKQQQEPEPEPEPEAPYWKARFIVTQDGGVDLPPDRHAVHNLEGTKARKKFLAEMTEVFPGDQLFAVIRSKLISREIKTREFGEVVLFADNGWSFTANSNASAGYCYVVARKV